MTNEIAPNSVALFGMSGVGKTRLASKLREQANWEHYSVDYRIGAHYLYDEILKNIPFGDPADSSLSAGPISERASSKPSLSVSDLSALSAYLGKPGDPDKGGLTFNEYCQRQRQHRNGEIAALLETPSRAKKAIAQGRPGFVCDTGGSFCELVDPYNDKDPILSALTSACMLVYIEADPSHGALLTARFEAAPKPMYYNEKFLEQIWREYLDIRETDEMQADPDDFALWGFKKLIQWRAPRYEAIAKKWGVTLKADSLRGAQNPHEILNILTAM